MASGTSRPFADNENEAVAPEVVLESGSIAGFSSGHTMTIPAGGTVSLVWEVIPSPSAPFIIDTTLPTATVANPYSADFSVSGGNEPLSWSASGLPAFFTVNSQSGRVTGTPPLSGNFDFEVSVSDNDGESHSRSFTLAIEPEIIAAAFAESGGSVTMEAEDFSSRDANGEDFNWFESSAGGTTFMNFEDGAANFSLAEWSSGAILRYDVNIETPGNYSLAIRRRAPDNGSDSIYVGVGGTQIGDRQFTGTAAEFSWTPPLAIGFLDQGLHTLELRRRESQMEVDRLYLGINLGSFPSGTATGPEASEQSVQTTPEPQGFERWKYINFTPSQVADDTVSGPLATPLADGLANRLKYAFGWTPWTSRPAIWPAGPLPDGRPTFNFERSMDPAAPDPTVWVSEALSGWNNDFTEFELDVIEVRPESETIRVTPPSDFTGESWFIRLSVPE